MKLTLNHLTIIRNVILGIFCLISISVMCFTIVKFTGTTDKTYLITEVRNYGKIPPTTYYTYPSSKKDFTSEEFITEVVDQGTNAEYVTAVGLTNISYPNAALYQISDQCYQVYFNDLRINPLFPLALANVETPGRADNNITWSALFPSKYVSFNELESFNVTDVALQPQKYNALMHEYSTRDRGALQMSPTYGTKDDYFNSLMSGTEVDKLKESSWDQSAAWWVQGASTAPGDRFVTRDVLYRLSAAGNAAIKDMSKHNIAITSDAEAIVMLAMYHHRSGVWAVDGAGGWKPGGKALEYVKQITTQDQLNKLIEYYQQNTHTYTITSDVAKSLLLCNYTDYTTSALEATYPIKVLYSYIVLVNLYGK